MQFKQILVPVDFSEPSWLALETAAALAQLSHADVDVLHVWEPPALAGPQEVYIGAVLPPVMIETLKQAAESALDALTKRARAQGITIRHARAIPGSVRDIIVEEAQRERYDLIVVGTHGRRALSRLLLGSVAERVVRAAPCPVLVARPGPAAEATNAAETKA